MSKSLHARIEKTATGYDGLIAGRVEESFADNETETAHRQAETWLIKQAARRLIKRGHHGQAAKMFGKAGGRSGTGKSKIRNIDYAKIGRAGAAARSAMRRINNA